MTSFQFQLLGGFQLIYEGVPVSEINQPRLQSLLAYLLLQRNAPCLRQQIAFLFWPESTEKAARTNLRSLLHRLRKAFPPLDQYILVGQQTIQFQMDASVALDVAQFETATARGAEAIGPGALSHLCTAVDLYQGDLLPDMYESWVLVERERLRNSYLDTLVCIVAQLEEERTYTDAIDFARRLLHADPLREASYRQLMRLHALRGERSAALQVYHTCAGTLRQELDVEPSAETQSVYTRLLQRTKENNQQTSPPPSRQLPPLVGRKREWRQLSTRWKQAAAGRPQLLLISGEPGIGKTRLAEELLTYVRRQGLTTARAGAYGVEGALTYAPVVEWLRSNGLARNVQRLDDVWLIELARILPEISTQRPDLPRAGPVEESWQRQRFWEALARAALTGGRPILLHIDDLQVCSRDMLAWLHFLLTFKAEAKLLVLGTMRREEMTREHPLLALLPALRRVGLVNEIELGPLSAAETATLAGHLHGHPLGAKEAQELYRKSEGNPLFVVEFVRTALTDPATADQSTGETTQPGLSLPERVQAVIGQRLHQLSTTAYRLAQVASVIGRSFAAEELIQSGIYEEETAIAGLDELWQRRIVREQEVNRYEFSHEMIREVLYASISLTQQRYLHRRIAAVMKTARDAPTAERTARLAHHLEQAGLRAKAVAAYTQAGATARSLSALAEAVRFYERALSLADDLETKRGPMPERLRILAELGWLYWLLGRKSNASRTFAAGLATAQTLDDPTQRAEFSRCLGVLAWDAGESARATKLLESALALQQQTGDRAGQARTLQNLGLVAEQQGDFMQAYGYYEQGVTVAREVGDRYHEGFAHNNLAFLLGERGSPDEAERHCRRALAIADELEHQSMRATFLRNLGFIRLMQQRPTAAERCFLESLRIAADTGGVSGSLESLVGMAYLAEQAGCPVRALHYLGVVSSHPLEGNDIRVRSKPLLERLHEQLPADVVSEHLDSGRQLTFDTVIHELLQGETPDSSRP